MVNIIIVKNGCLSTPIDSEVVSLAGLHNYISLESRFTFGFEARLHLW